MLTISLQDLPPGATMANVMVKLGVFPSVTQARKNGWDKPIELGEQLLTKRRISVNIVSRALDSDEAAPKEIYRPDLEPGFWAEWIAPTTNVGRAIQYPEDSNFFSRMIGAYNQDEKLKRAEKKQK